MTQTSTLPLPYGGELVDRLASESEREEWLRKVDKLPKVLVTPVTLANTEMISIGGYSPLKGFMDKKAYHSVVQDMRLPDGLVWSIHIVLPVPEENEIKRADAVAIYGSENFQHEGSEAYSVVQVNDLFKRDKEREAKNVHGTTDLGHPGVERIFSEPEWLVGGEVLSLRLPSHQPPIRAHYMTTRQTHALFAARGYKRVVGFQTQNPLHRAHEYLVKCALETVDGLLLHLLVGPTKSDDIPADVRMRCCLRDTSRRSGWFWLSTLHPCSTLDLGRQFSTR